jgi:hypothetical protein
MIGRAPSAARDLFDNGGLFSRLQHGVSRMHQLVKTGPVASIPAPSPTHVYECAFYRPASQSRSRQSSSDETPKAPSTVADADCFDLVVTGLDGISILVASFLDGRSLARMQFVNRSWRAFITLHHEELFQDLLRREFDTVITSSTTIKSYLLSLRHELGRELAHCHYVEHAHAALERYCTEIEPENHGFVAMFCDIVRFRDPRIARFVADRRKGAMNMVVTATPEHVLAFRRASPDAGQIAFVPFDNPHWPQFDLPRIQFPGFMGYAFDHVEIVPGYEALKETVVKAALKELMLFDTAENAAAYGAAVGKPPFAAIVGGTEQAPNYHMTFSNPLREELRHLSISGRIDVLNQRIALVDHSLSHLAWPQQFMNLKYRR